jgi:hypothetical protein
MSAAKQLALAFDFFSSLSLSSLYYCFDIENEEKSEEKNAQNSQRAQRVEETSERTNTATDGARARRQVLSEAEVSRRAREPSCMYVRASSGNL